MSEMPTIEETMAAEKLVTEEFKLKCRPQIIKRVLKEKGKRIVEECIALVPDCSDFIASRFWLEWDPEVKQNNGDFEFGISVNLGGWVTGRACTMLPDDQVKEKYIFVMGLGAEDYIKIHKKEWKRIFGPNKRITVFVHSTKDDNPDYSICDSAPDRNRDLR